MISWPILAVVKAAQNDCLKLSCPLSCSIIFCLLETLSTLKEIKNIFTYVAQWLMGEKVKKNTTKKFSTLSNDRNSSFIY